MKWSWASEILDEKRAGPQWLGHNPPHGQTDEQIYESRGPGIHDYHEILWNIMKYYEILWNIMKYYEVLWNIMKYYEILGNIRKY